MRGLRRAAAFGGAAMALAGSAFAADQLAGRDTRGAASAAVTISTSAPLFDETGLVGGERMQRCTVLTNEGPQPADVTLFGSAEQADLSPWLELELVRGTLPDGQPAGSCTGFTPDEADYGSGDPGVVYRGTLADLPGSGDGIADPTRWAVGERHAYLLRLDYTGGDPQQGRSTVQSFAWGATPFDDRPAPDPFVDPGAADPTSGAGAAAEGDGDAPAAGGPQPTIRLARACRVITFPTRSYIGARAISRPKKIPSGAATRSSASSSGEASTGQALSSSEPGVVSSGVEDQGLAPAEQLRRERLLRATQRSGRGAARRAPVLVVRLSPGKNETLAVRVGLRKNAKMTSPRRWRWVRMRLNATATKSTLKWPFTATAKMGQLRTGYNQLDLTLNRGTVDERLEGLPRLMRRSFAFVVGEPSTTTTGGGSSADCTLG